MLLKNGVEESLLFNMDKIQQLRSQAQRMTLAGTVSVLERIEQARSQLASHVNTGLILETLILDIQEGI